MKRGFGVFIFVLALLFLSLTIVSAFSFGDFYNKITGKAIDDSSQVYDFGGMYSSGTKNYNNPITGARSCPTGYTAKRTLGYSGKDNNLYFCYKSHQSGVESQYDFGGVYGTPSSTYTNPATSTKDCPAGYIKSQVFGLVNVDYNLYFCYKNHVSGQNPALDFGGFYAPSTAISFLNPATSARSCPAGYTSSRIFGYSGVDYGLNICTKIPTTVSTIVCKTNSDCGSTESSANYCLNTNLVKDTTVNVCSNPGTAQSSCSTSTSTSIVQECGNLGCENGACKTAIACTDSDGVNYNVRGNVTGYGDDGSYGTWSDGCIYTDTLVEQVCLSNNRVNATFYQCPNGCSNGACLEETGTSNSCANYESYSIYGPSSRNGYYDNGWAHNNAICLQVIEPNEMNVYYIGDIVPIRWKQKGVDSVSIGIKSCPSCLDWINTSVVPDRSREEQVYFWNISRTYPGQFTNPTKNYTIEITGINSSYGASVIEGSNKTFLVYDRSSTLSCTDTDGLNYYVKGNLNFNGQTKVDDCLKDRPGPDGGVYENAVSDWVCAVPSNILSDPRVFGYGSNYSNGPFDVVYDCPNGCSNGACIGEVPTGENLYCPELIEKVSNPSDFSLFGKDYHLSWNYSYTGKGYSYYESNFTSYQAGWDLYDDVDEQNYFLNYEVLVFDESDFDTSILLDELLSYRICRIDSYYDNSIENKVYVCSYDVLRQQQSTDNWQWNNRQLLWNNGNVLVQINLYFGSSLTEEQVDDIAHKKLFDFIDDLKNNDFEYVDAGYFKLPSAPSGQIFNSLSQCSSQVQSYTLEGTNETCYPSWSCKIEPTVCPEYGYQNRICVDSGCNQPTKEEQIQCSPGICSGCYVPRFYGFGGNSNNGNNICIPYGIRLEKAQNEDERIVEGDHGDGLSFSIIDSNSGHLIINQEGNILFDSNIYVGEEYKIDFSEYGGDVIRFRVNGVVPGQNDVPQGEFPVEGGELGYADITVTASFNAYCDYDGQVKQQKSKEGNGNWAKCQNNYECESNICSSGECIDVAGAIRETGRLKDLAIRGLCRLSNLFSEESYQECLVKYIN